jgi:uncharacterized membrane protein YeaQ/YmgE (transglycosylase-associated protein family)
MEVRAGVPGNVRPPRGVRTPVVLQALPAAGRPATSIRQKETRTMIVSFLIALIVGAVAGYLHDQVAGPGWLAAQITGTRSTVTSALVGIAGAFIGIHVALLIGLLGFIWHLIFAVIGAAAVLFAWRSV